MCNNFGAFVFKVRAKKLKEDPEYVEPSQSKNLKRKVDSLNLADEIMRRPKRSKPSVNLAEKDETSADELGDEFTLSPASRRQSAQIQKTPPKRNRSQNRRPSAASSSLASNVIKQLRAIDTPSVAGKSQAITHNELTGIESAMTGMGQEMSLMRAEMSQIRALLEMMVQSPHLLGQVVGLLKQLVEKQ
jgi:hypothetical protein